MLFRSVTLLILTLFSLQIATQEISISEVTSHLSLLRDTATSVLTDAFRRYRACLEKLDSLAITTKSTASLDIRTYSEEYLQRFEDLSKSAAEAKVDITTCVTIAGDVLKNLGPENDASLVACINQLADEGLKYIRSSGGISNGYVLDLLFDGEQQVIHCGEVDAECLHQTGDFLLKSINTMPGTVAFAVGKHESSFEDYLFRIKSSCRDRYTQTTRDKGKYFLQLFEDCVDFYTNNTVH